MSTDEDDVLCQSCGRALAEPASRALGLGPVCRRALRQQPLPVPGQLALDIPLSAPDHPKERRP